MAEPDSTLILEVLKEMRADLRRLEGKVDANHREVVTKLDDQETKLDGLTHAVIAGFGALVHEIDDLKTRVARLERAPA